MSSEFTGTVEPCPECRRRGQDRSGDNLAVYTDHKYCFACGYGERSGRLSLDHIKSQFHSVELEKKKNDRSNLPDDCSLDLRLDARAWLKKYGLTEQEFEDNKFLWSPKKELLIFPIFVDGLMVMWQGRYFGSNPNYPKYNTQGFKNDVFYIKGKGEPLVLTEDLISAIKVGRQYSASPLWCSNANRKQLLTYSRYYESIAIWLDSNMREQSLKLQQRAELFFREVRVVFSDLDPKCYSDGEIRAFIGS